MIEAYAFLAAFTVQILTMSVLCPAWLTRYLRAQAANIPAGRFEQLYPGVDLSGTLERYLTRYRLLNTGIAMLGLLPLGWLFSYTQRPDWDDGPAEALAAVYFMFQASPILLIALSGSRHRKALEILLDGKRKAVLQRRTIFDFVSPFSVFLSVSSYFLFVAYVLYIERNPFPGFNGYITIGVITLGYAMNAFGVYKVLYGKKLNPFETHASRVRAMGLSVKGFVYSGTLCVVFLSLNFTLVMRDLQRWEPFAQSVFFVICALLSFISFTAPPRRKEADGLGEGQAI